MDPTEAPNAYENLYLAPDVDESEYFFDLAYQHFCSLEQDVIATRIEENKHQEGITPFMEVSKSLSHWRYVETCLNNFRAILAECMGSSDVISSNLITLSQTIAAFQSIEEQMYLVYLNLFKIHYQVFSDDELYQQIVEEANKQAAVATEEMRAWLAEEQLKHPPKFQQLSLDLPIPAAQVT